MKNKKISFVILVLLVLILFCAFILRIIYIDILPSGIYPDEAVNGVDALTAHESGDYKLFYTNNNGREGLYINLISFSVRWFGNTALGLKFWSIIFGTLSVLGAFLLTHELFKIKPSAQTRFWQRGSRYGGTITAFLVAFSFWSIIFSRISFRAIMVPVILTFCFYFLFRAVRTQSLFLFAIAGFIFGLGFNTYIAFRIAPLLIIVLFLSFLISREGFFKKYWKGFLIFLCTAFIALAPLLITFIIHPEYINSRSSNISILSPHVNNGHLFLTLRETFFLSISKYTFLGDQNWRHNHPPYPLLDPLTGLAFLGGFILILFSAIKLFIMRIFKNQRDTYLDVYIFLLAWFFILLIPEFMTKEGLPHALRSIGTLPVVYIIATFGFLWILDKIPPHYRHKKIIYSFVIFILLFISMYNIIRYFILWNHAPEQHSSFNENYRNMSRFLINLPPEIPKYVLPNGSGQNMNDGFPVSTQVVKYLTHNKVQNLTYITPETLLTVPCIIVLMNHDQDIINNITKYFSGTEIKTISLTPNFGGEFTVIYVNTL